MTGAGMSPAMGMGLVSIPAMAAMMLPSAVPAIARRARRPDGPVAAPLFAASYLGVWAVIALAVTVVYRPPSAMVAGALIVAAGLYELTPLKRRFRRRCLSGTGNGLGYGLACVGSSLGLMVTLVAISVMSVAWMAVLGLIIAAQKLLRERIAVDLPVAGAVIALGVLALLSPTSVPGLLPAA